MLVNIPSRTGRNMVVTDSNVWLVLSAKRGPKNISVITKAELLRCYGRNFDNWDSAKKDVCRELLIFGKVYSVLLRATKSHLNEAEKAMVMMVDYCDRDMISND